ncbi:MAG TPA: 5-formyltetrahydrofolate cyclo-ligase [Anaerolineae bacterium]|nr:5-formyltetrahydrofolate cyclo-ligase [Anaerolineae bacterium]
MAEQQDSQSGRWEGRNNTKDSLRTEIWSALEQRGIAIGPAFSRIPNFVGAEQAAARLAELSIWQNAKVVKSNPDPPQIPVRLRALQDGKLLYTPVPELVKGFPFIELDPEDLRRRGIPFEAAAPSEGALEYGRKVNFDQMQPFDLVVVGCVAVTRQGGRTGKGGGFADLELGIFREMGLVKPGVPIVTTVHGTQLVDNDRVVMVGHDSALDWIITPEEVIETRTPYPQPKGVDWQAVQADQYRDIPFLVSLRDSLIKKQ